MSKLSRRSLVTAAAALPALAVPAVVATAGLDDTLERIAEHRRVVRAIDGICDRMDALEEVLPEDRRNAYSILDRGTDVERDDDPRWTAVQAEFWTAEDRKDEIAWSFVDQPPTTTEGVAAILAYGEEYEEAGHQWPMYRFHFTVAGAYAGKKGEDWRKSLNRAIVPAFRSAPTVAGVSPMPRAGAADAELPHSMRSSIRSSENTIRSLPLRNPATTMVKSGICGSDASLDADGAGIVG
jgi:hypothetical protein